MYPIIFKWLTKIIDKQKSNHKHNNLNKNIIYKQMRILHKKDGIKLFHTDVILH